MLLPSLSGSRPLPPVVPLPGGLGHGVVRGRVHEFCGPSRVGLAVMTLEQTTGSILWIFPGWIPDRLYPPGLSEFIEPGRIIFVKIRRDEDLLWAMEEGLRSGAAPAVVAECQRPPGLTPIRRLHLATQEGAERAFHWHRPPPLGLVLTPEMGGAQGVESRWHLRPTPSRNTLTHGVPTWELSRLRSRMEPTGSWHISRISRLP